MCVFITSELPCIVGWICLLWHHDTNDDSGTNRVRGHNQGLGLLSIEVLSLTEITELTELINLLSQTVPTDGTEQTELRSDGLVGGTFMDGRAV